jgi:Reverse transcriptase (RNA-dependent DNA polymerase)
LQSEDRASSTSQFAAKVGMRLNCLRTKILKSSDRYVRCITADRANWLDEKVMIAKAGGGERPLGLPTIKDRVIQTAAKLVLEPIFEADMENCAYGYRPKRSAVDAVKVVHKALTEGYTQVVDADLSKYFDTFNKSIRVIGRYAA